MATTSTPADEEVAPPGGGRHESDGPGRPPAVSTRELGRWAWRQLTSMRTALLLLLALALAAVPGSLVPQQGVDSLKVAQFMLRHPDLSPWFERLGLFSVYSSPWFAAIYLLLMVSLIGCVVPRTVVYARALRARPPRTPSRLDRLPAYVSYETDRAPAGVLTDAEGLLRRQRFRTDRDGGSAPGTAAGSVRAEKGYLRETGNLVFHGSLLIVLVGVAVGALWGYRGSVIVVEGQGFSNTLTQYDEFTSGALSGAESLPPFSLSLDQMTAEFQTEGEQAGQPKLFEASGTVTPAPGEAAEDFDIEVNHPLTVDGTSVFLLGSGYAPEITVRDGAGDIAFSGPVAFLPADSSYVSEGVVKAPDAQPEQLGLEGLFLPWAVQGSDGISRSLFPEPANPELDLFVYTGDLGLDDGGPQSVFALDKDDLELVEGADGETLRLALTPGERVRLPDGLGSVSFDGVREFARFQVASTPLSWLPLAGLVLAVTGLTGSLFIRPRRIWVRARAVGDRTVVEVAGLDRVSGGELATDLDDVVARLRDEEEGATP
ncbi:MAG TPA: cytochrome c biogenesis protein ResB [Nocardioidaceae bacterium]|nr:cytochrome c biogenesis protein ResB [Nocardioidaceae bacterium]